jgi:hypothetical protein
MLFSKEKVSPLAMVAFALILISKRSGMANSTSAFHAQVVYVC